VNIQHDMLHTWHVNHISNPFKKQFYYPILDKYACWNDPNKLPTNEINNFKLQNTFIDNGSTILTTNTSTIEKYDMYI
jgi:hypothetical protein